MPNRADVIIIGAGIIGLSTAYHLLSDGAINVVLIDRGPIGGVASPRAAGSLRHHYSHPLLVEMAVRSHAFFREFAMKSPVDFGYVRNGYLLGVDEHQTDWLVENVKIVQSIGVDTRIISSHELSSLYPQLDASGWSGAVAHDRDTAHVQPPAFMRALTKAVRDLGADMIQGTAVTGIDIQGGAVHGVMTADGSSVEAPVVLNAAGAWASQIAQLAGVEIPVEVRRLLQIFELLPSFEIPMQRPTLSDGPLDLYARPNPGNRLLVGARHYFDAPMHPDEVSLYPVHETVNDTRRRFEQLLPESRNAPIYQAWAGIDGETPDYQPVIGPIAGVQGLLVAAGFSGHGFKLGPIVGQTLAELIRHGESRSANIRALGIDRFATGDLFPIGYKQMGA